VGEEGDPVCGVGETVGPDVVRQNHRGPVGRVGAVRVASTCIAVPPGGATWGDTGDQYIGVVVLPLTVVAVQRRADFVQGGCGPRRGGGGQFDDVNIERLVGSPDQGDNVPPHVRNLLCREVAAGCCFCGERGEREGGV